MDPRASKTNPGAFLAGLIGRSVRVRLTTGTDFQGKLLSMDGSMNIALESAKELDPLSPDSVFDRVLLRGNNVLYIKQN